MVHQILIQVSDRRKSQLTNPKATQSFTSFLHNRNRYQSLKEEDLTASMIIDVEFSSEGLHSHRGTNIPGTTDMKMVRFIQPEKHNTSI